MHPSPSSGASRAIWLRDRASKAKSARSRGCVGARRQPGELLSPGLGREARRFRRWAALVVLSAALGLGARSETAGAELLDLGTADETSDVDVNADGAVDADDQGMMVGAQGTCSGDAAFDPAADRDGNGCVDRIDVALVRIAGTGVGGDAASLATVDWIDECDPADPSYPNVIEDSSIPGAFIVQDCGPLCENFPIPPIGEWDPTARVAIAGLHGDALDYEPEVCSPSNPAFIGFATMRCPDDVPEGSRWLYEACLTVSTASGFDNACPIMPPPVAAVCQAAATGGALACCDAVLNTRVSPAWLCAYLGASAASAGVQGCTDCCNACCDATWPVSEGENVVQNSACKSACSTGTTLPPTTTTTLAATTTTSSTSTTSMTLPVTTATTTVAATTTTATLPSTTSSTSLPATTTSTTARATTTTTPTTTTTTTTIPATCAAAGIVLPTTLPDQTMCTAAATAAGTQTLCRGWETVGRLYRGAGDLASLPGGAASSGQFYKWVSGTTTCLYLYRVRPDNGQTLNGVHCYNTTTCDVCAFDFKGARPTLWRLLQTPAAPGFEDCSECHAAGPVTPKKPFWDGVKAETEAINLECAKRGGPRWIAAPLSWTQEAAGRHVTAPAKCSACHSEGFVNGARLFCDAIVRQTFGPGGAMRGKTFKDKAACEKFTSDMGCDVTANPFNCS